jgi:SPP1 family holin
MNNRKIGTIVRTAVLVLALANSIFVAVGRPVIELEDETITVLINALFTVAAAIWSWWKNNSVTKAAVTADQVLDAIREGTITATEIAETIMKRKGE